MRYWLRSILVIGLLMAGLTEAAWGADYYVRKTGDNAPNLCTLASPCLTINKGLTKLTPGDTLYIGAGTYVELINNIPAGTAAGEVTVRAIASGSGYEEVILKPNSGSVIDLSGNAYHHITIQGLILDAIGGGSRAFVVSATGTYWNAALQQCGDKTIANAAHDITLIDVEMKNGKSSCLSVSPHASDITIINPNVHDCGSDVKDHGAYVSGQRLTIDGGKFWNNSGHGIHAYHGLNIEHPECDVLATGFVLKNTRLFGNRVGGTCGNGFVDCTIYNILAYQNLGGGFTFKGSDGPRKMYNSTLWGNNVGISYGEQVASAEITNNIIDKEQVVTGASGIVRTTNLISTTAAPIDPLFVDAANGDFRVQSGSRAITDPSTTIALVTTDIVGTARPAGDYTIGAYQFVTGVDPFNFSLANTGDKTVDQGASVANTITVTGLAGTAAAVTFSASGLPTNATVGFVPTNCTPTTPCTSTATIQTQLTTPQGTFPITITGRTAAGLTRTTSFVLTVTCP